MKVLHVFYSFLPDVSGSSIRSAGLIAGQLAQSMQIAAVSSPFQPGFGDGNVEDYLGARVYRAHRPGHPAISEKGSSAWSRVRKVALFPAFVSHIYRAAKAERAEIIHAHSTFYCAIAGFVVARLLRLKFVYEFRSLWEERARTRDLGYRIQSWVSRSLETLSLRLADQVVTINEGLKAEVVHRGIPASKVNVVPNAVDDALIAIGSRMEPPDRITRFGYVGSISAIEGLDVLVEAFGLAFPNGEDVELLFHGGGAYEAELKRLVAATRDPRIRIAGPFKREAVEAVYRSIDCVVLARHRSKLNDAVTPLKPLEAMAFKRLVGVSDARGLVEVIGSTRHAWVFPADDAEQLAAHLRRVHCRDFDARGMATRGHRFITESRAWSSIAEAYADIYAKCA